MGARSVKRFLGAGWICSGVAGAGLAIGAAAGPSGETVDTGYAAAARALIVPVAHADEGRRRPSLKALDRRRDHNDAQKSVAQQQQSANAAAAAQKSVQDAEAAKKRVQEFQEAALQRRLQQLKNLESSQKSAQQLQHQADVAQRVQRLQALSSSGQSPAVGQQPRAIFSNQQHRVQETMRRIHERAREPDQHAIGLQAHPQTASTRYPAVFHHTLTKLLGNKVPSRYAFKPEARTQGAYGGEHRLPSGLQRGFGKLHYGQHLAHSDRGRPSQYNSPYVAFLKRGSAYLHRLKGNWKNKNNSTQTAEETKTPATPTTTTTTSTSKTSNHKTSTGNALVTNAPDISATTTPIISKLPALASNNNANNKSESNSDSGMSRLGGPQDPSDDKDQGSRIRTTKKSDDANGDDDGARQSVRRGSGRVVADLLPAAGSFRPNQVLAINLSGAGLAKAKQLNLIVADTVELPALGLKVTYLEVPSTSILNAVGARTALAEALPAEEFNFNRIYVAGRLAPAGTDAPSMKPGGPGRPMPNPGRPGQGCGPDRCFAPSVINWQPQLAACARGIRIGIIDTGVDKSHPAFAGLSFEHKDFTSHKGRKPSNQHGTGVFSLLAGNPQSSTPGLVPEATFFVGDAFFADSAGNPVSDTMTMLRALDWLKSARVDVANLSFAGPEDGLVHDGIRALARAGTAIVAAAGNEGPDAPKSYPAGYGEVIAVTAVDRKLSPYVYANRGSHIDVAAPGVDVWTALPNRKEGPQTGTSFAVPFVTSVVALTYRAEERGLNGDPLAPKQRALALLQSNIKSLGARGRNPIFGVGLVQAPANCEPRGSAAVASVGPAETNSWTGTVHAVPAAAIQPQAGPWASTMQRAKQ